MRQIKFRAWDDLNKKWRLGYDRENLGGFSMMGEVMLFGAYNQMLDSFKLEDLHHLKLMQFTGLKDRNGVEIYEGDILMHHRHGKKTVMKWIDNYICFAGETIDDIVKGEFNYYQSIDVKDLEVIGNIYEHHNLLTNE